MKADPALRPIPVIVFSLYGDAAVIRQCYALGANCYLVKSAGLDALFGAIHPLVGYWLTAVRLPDPPLPPPG